MHHKTKQNYEAKAFLKFSFKLSFVLSLGKKIV